jgi:hypothetical protein
MSDSVDEELARLEREVIAKIKGMLGRGDSVDDISVWFGVNARVVHAIAAGASYVLIQPAPRNCLPPQGPYRRTPHAYGALREVRDAERRLRFESTIVRGQYK